MPSVSAGHRDFRIGLSRDVTSKGNSVQLPLGEKAPAAHLGGLGFSGLGSRQNAFNIPALRETTDFFAGGWDSEDNSRKGNIYKELNLTSGNSVSRADTPAGHVDLNSFYSLFSSGARKRKLPSSLQSGGSLPSAVPPKPQVAFSLTEASLSDAGTKTRPPKGTYHTLEQENSFTVPLQQNPTFDTYANETRNRVPSGPLQKRIERRLSSGLKRAQQQMRFDALMRSDGTFKRQIWADMIKDGIIGQSDNKYHRQNQRTETPLGNTFTARAPPDGPGARDAKSFLDLLVRRFGNFMRAWRNGLDFDGNGRISYFEFCKAARAVGYEASLRQLWNELNQNDDKAFITLDELDQETFDRMNYLNDILTAKFSSTSDAWRFFDVEGRKQVYYETFSKTLIEKLGWEPEKHSTKLLFEDLDCEANGFLTVDAWQFLRNWVTDKDLEMIENFRNVFSVVLNRFY